jgi:hypothetical protein
MSKVLGNIDLNDAEMMRDPTVRVAVCSIARQHVERHFEQYIADWMQRQGDLLKVSEKNISFFGDAFQVSRDSDGSLALSMHNSAGQTIPCNQMPVALTGLADMLRQAALNGLQRIEYEAIACEAALPQVTYHEALYGARGSASPALLDKITHGQFKSLVDQAVAAIRKQIRPCDAALARRCQPRKATLDTFNFVMKNRAVLRQLNKEAPHLLALLYAAHKEKKIDRIEDSAFKALKDCLLKAGLGEAVWKTLAHMGSNHLRWLVFHYGFQKTLKLADLVTRSQIVPPVPLLARWANDSGEGPASYYYNRYQPPAWFRRAAAAYANSLPSDQVADFVENDYANACDWVHANLTRPDANQLRAGWKWIKRQSDEWHKRTSQRGTYRNLSWQSLVDEYEEGDYRVVPLVTSAALTDEGQKMHHCVGSYDHYCVSGHSRIFSFRETATGKPVATAEIRLQGETWQLSQVRGPCNANVDTTVHSGVNALLRKYNRAYTALMAADADADM